MVIIDSAPLQLVSDAQVLSQFASSVIYVVKADATPYQVAQNGLKKLRRVSAADPGRGAEPARPREGREVLRRVQRLQELRRLQEIRLHPHLRRAPGLTCRASRASPPWSPRWRCWHGWRSPPGGSAAATRSSTKRPARWPPGAHRATSLASARWHGCAKISRSAAADAPADPTVEEMLGRLAARRPATRRSRRGAGSFHARGQLRPTSPYTWAASSRRNTGWGIPGSPSRRRCAGRPARTLRAGGPAHRRGFRPCGLGRSRPGHAAGGRNHGYRRNETRSGRCTALAVRRGRLALACRHLADAPRRVDRGWSQLCASRETPS